MNYDRVLVIPFLPYYLSHASLFLVTIVDCTYFAIPCALSGFVPDPVPPSPSGSYNSILFATCSKPIISGGTLEKMKDWYFSLNLTWEQHHVREPFVYD